MTAELTGAESPAATDAPEETASRRWPPASWSPGNWSPHSWAFAAVLLVVFGIAILPVALDLAQPAGLYGITQYDDGVYFAAALRLVSGVLPYRDFVLVQPPGIAELLAPFAALSHLVGGRHALALARLATMCVVGLTACLVAITLRHRGLMAALIGGLALAIFPTAYAADHTFLIEPYLCLFCIVGVALVFSHGELASNRRILLGGVAFGIAGAVKSFAIVPFLILFVLLALRRQGAALRLLIGAAIAVVVLIVPFVIAAPHGFVTDVISSQLNRATVHPTPILNRIFAITGLAYSSATLPVAGPATVAAGVTLAVLIVFGGLLPALRGKADALQWFAVVASFGVVAMMFLPPVYYDHYAFFSAPFLALCLGGVAGNARDAVQAVTRRFAAQLRRAVMLGGAAVTVVALGLASFVILSSATSYQKLIVDKFGDNGPAIAALVPGGACVLSDAETVLVTAGRAGTGPKGCPAIIDATGTWLTYEPDFPPVRSGIGPKDPALVALWQQAFSHADYVVLSGVKAFRIPFTPALLSWFNQHYTRLPNTTYYVYRNNAVPPGYATPTTR